MIGSIGFAQLKLFLSNNNISNKEQMVCMGIQKVQNKFIKLSNRLDM